MFSYGADALFKTKDIGAVTKDLNNPLALEYR